MELKDFENKNLIFESVWKTIALSTLSGLFVFSALVTNVRVEEPLIFWSTIGLFGFGLLHGLYKLLNPNSLFIRPGSKLAQEYHRLDFDRRLNDHGFFVFTQNGFEVDLGNQVCKYLWTDIAVIFGYKKDLRAIEMVFMDIFTIDETHFTINEETPGWYQFLEKSKENLNGIPDNWEIEITTPVFETKLTLLYDKENRSQNEVIESVYESK